MSDRDVVIRVENISKLYRLGEVGTGFHPELTGQEPEGWQARRALRTGRSANQILIVDEVLAVGDAEFQKNALAK